MLMLKVIKKIVGKRANAGDQHFLLFPQCFQPYPRQILIFELCLIRCLQMLLIWTELKAFKRHTTLLNHWILWLTLSQMTNFRLFQIERVCRRQFQILSNGGKFSKREENTVGKGDIAHYEQFLFFPLCFQKTCTADM